MANKAGLVITTVLDEFESRSKQHYLCVYALPHELEDSHRKFQTENGEILFEGGGGILRISSGDPPPRGRLAAYRWHGLTSSEEEKYQFQFASLKYRYESAVYRVVRVGREFGLTVTRQEYRDTGLRGKRREYYEIIPFGFMSRMYDSIVAADKTLALYAAKVSFLQRPALKFDRFPQKAEVAVDRAIKRIMSR